MLKFISNLRIKIITLFLILNLVGFSYLCYSEQLLNQDVDISFGSTLSNSSLPVSQLTGGPFTIDNAGTIESTNGNTIRIDVDTTLNNTGLIDADVTENGQAIQFFQNSGNNSLTNSGTIRIESKGAFSPAIKVQASTVSSITNTATGTIQSSGATTVAEGIRVDSLGSSVNLITNEGSITATGPGGARGISVLGDSAASVNQINNSGSITAQGGTGVTNGIVFWGGGTSVVNSGSIIGTATDQNANGINFARDLTTLNNSGAISGSQHGVYVGGTLTNIINTGTITGTAGYGINNGGSGSITNLTNSQNNLTYNGKLPTNYYVKVNSSSSYGKITFSNPRGSMNVGVADDSILSVGTYSAVINGLSGENISNSSGTFINDNNHYKYSINNSAGTQWDLVIDDLTSDTQCSVNSNNPGCSKTNCITSSIETTLNTLANGNFAHMNTYDCDTFGKTGNCISIGGRYISINDPKSETSGVVLVYGKKHSQNFRWGGFIHYNIDYNTSSNLALSDKIPLIGFYGVWNENTDKSGLQFKIGNSYQAINATIIRPQAGVSEKAKGETNITANKFILELRNNIHLSNITTVSPYLAMRYSEKYQKGYTEKNVDLPLTFNKIFDNSWSIIGGIKYNFKINKKYRFDGTFGVDHDISHNVSKLSPNGVSGITSVDLTKNRRSTRYIVSFGLDNKVTKKQILRLKVQYEELPYQGMNESNIYATYNFLF